MNMNHTHKIFKETIVASGGGQISHYDFGQWSK